jgi:MFS family permease
MVGASETYFSALALALGKGSVLAGLAATMPNLAGSLLQLASPAGLRRIGSPRRWIQGCAVLQSLSLLGLVAGAIVGSMPTWLMLACLTGYWTAALGAGPAWNTWVAHLFPGRLRARYFSVRSRLCNLLQLAAMLASGGLLWLSERGQWPLWGFALVLFAAAMCRTSSVVYLQRQGDVKLQAADVRPLAWRSLPRRLFSGDLRILLYLAAFQGALNVAGPFITPWMIDHLGMDKLRFTLCVAVVFISKSLAMPLVSRLVRRFGTARVMAFSGAGTAITITLMAAVPHLGWILLMQAIFGACMAGWDLAAFLLLLERLRHEERTSLMSLYMTMNCAAVALGSLLGGLVLEWSGSWPHAYAMVFGLSGALRLAAILLRPRQLHPRAVVVAQA